MNVIDQLFQRENKDSLAELWVGMLQYYTEQFQFDRHLVQVFSSFKYYGIVISRFVNTPKWQHLKRSGHQNVFQLKTHSNWAIILVVEFREKWRILLSKCCNGRAHFSVHLMKIFLQNIIGIQIRANFQKEGVKNFYQFLFLKKSWFLKEKRVTSYKACFSSSILTDGEEVPNDRCCRTCGKIGHFSKDCPRSRKNMKKLMKDPNYIQVKSELRKNLKLVKRKWRQWNVLSVSKRGILRNNAHKGDSQGIIEDTIIIIKSMIKRDQKVRVLKSKLFNKERMPKFNF